MIEPHLSDEVRTALAEQLFENLLTLLLRHKRTPAAAGAYFNKGLLAARTHDTDAEKPHADSAAK